MNEIVKRKPGRPPKVRVEQPVSTPDDAPVYEAPASEFGDAVGTGEDQVVEPEAPLTLPQSIALDRDHDGNPGGSWPQASLTENETRGMIAEFFDAYESQVENKRVDTFNRVWSFRHEAVHSQDTMVLSVKRGPVVAERHVPASMARFTDVGALLAELDQETGR